MQHNNEEKELVLAEYDKVLSSKLKLHIFRNDFKPEPFKRLRPILKNLNDYFDHIYHFALENKEKDKLQDEIIDSFELLLEEE